MLPEQWRELPGNQRDLALTLHTTGPLSGTELYNACGGVREHQGKMSTYRHLRQLIDAGYVSESERDGRTDEYALTSKGEVLVREYLDALMEL